MDVVDFHGPFGQVLMEIAGGIGEGGKDDDFPDRLSITVDIGLREPLLQNGLQALEFRIAVSGDRLGTVQ